MTSPLTTTSTSPIGSSTMQRWRTLPALAGIMLFTGAASWTPLSAADAPTTDAAALALEQLRATNIARHDLAQEEATWTVERERLRAAIAATRAETARLERDATDAETQRDQARAHLAELGKINDLDSVRSRLGETATQIRSALQALARTSPPGAVMLPAEEAAGDLAFDAAVRALDAAERAAGSVAVEVVSGTRAGQVEAVKLLRVAGAAAWWVSLDNTAAGTARMLDGKLQLDPATDEATRSVIIAALAQAEGRAQPLVVILPTPVAAKGTP